MRKVYITYKILLTLFILLLVLPANNIADYLSI